MAQNIANVKKLERIIAAHKRLKPNDPFIFELDDSLRIRQLIAESLVAFFAKLNDKPIPRPVRLKDLPNGKVSVQSR